jgi:hypothetical protein
MESILSLDCQGSRDNTIHMSVMNNMVQGRTPFMFSWLAQEINMTDGKSIRGPRLLIVMCSYRLECAEWLFSSVEGTLHRE